MWADGHRSVSFEEEKTSPNSPTNLFGPRIYMCVCFAKKVDEMVSYMHSIIITALLVQIAQLMLPIGLHRAYIGPT